MDQQFFDNIYKKTEGFLLDEEARFLYSLAEETIVKGSILEIGSWKGKSTVIFGHATQKKNLGKVYAVDPHTGSPEHGKVWTFPQFEANVKRAGVSELVVPIVKTSEEAAKTWEGPIRVLWIDGNHDYEHAMSDFKSFEPHVVPGGMVAFHDTVLGEEVGQVVKEVLFTSNRFKNIRFIGTIVCAEKAEKASFGNQFANFFSLILWKGYSAYSNKKLPIPKFIKNILKRLLKSKLADEK